MMQLDGQWELLPTRTFRGGYYSESEWLSMDVPSHWQQHPQLEYYSGKMVYRRRFMLKKETGRRYRLRLNGVFYFTIAYLNGFRLGENEGYCFAREFDITTALKNQAVPNELILEVDCPDEQSKNRKTMITGVFSHWDCLDPKTNPGGIWQSVEILESGAQYVSELRLTPVDEQAVNRLAGKNPPTGIALRAALEVDSDRAADVVCRLTLTPYNFEGEPQVFTWPQKVSAGDNAIAHVVELGDPRLWWVHDLGYPSLYTVRVELFSDETLRERLDNWETRWGLCRFEIRDWIPHLNGVRFFMKGNNYPPGDTRIAVMTHADYERDLRLAKDAHMNFLRVHAHVEKPAFYAAADEMGILLWQDFPLQWGYARAVLAQAERQAPLMVRALANHPSIALWCMHNEPIYIIDTEERGLRPLLTAGLAAYVWSWDRNVMDTRLKAVAESCDPTRPVIRASGKWALPWLEDTDSHFYFGWYKAFDGPKRRFELIKRLFPRSLHFVTEFGAQSFPNLESAVKFMDADIQRVDWAHLAERHHFQPKVMADWYNWRGARSLAALIDLTQDYQIEINQYYIDWLRFHKYRPCGGFAPFMFHDSNPAVQWSILDYWRVPKRSYFHMQVALNPEYVFTLIPKNRYRVGESVDLPVYAVNDARMTYDGIQVRATLFDPAGQTEWQSEVMTAALEGDCMAKHVGRAVFAPKQAGRYQLALEIRYGDRQLRNEYRLTVGD